MCIFNSRLLKGPLRLLHYFVMACLQVKLVDICKRLKLILDTSNQFCLLHGVACMSLMYIRLDFNTFFPGLKARFSLQPYCSKT